MYSSYSTRPSLILGFHGCEESVRDAALSGHKDLVASENEYDWLGHGIYFWENNYGRALQWAQEHGCKKPSVLGAVINLGLCLDLLDSDSIELVKASYSNYARTMTLMGQPIPQNRGGRDNLIRNLDCAVILSLHDGREVEKQPPLDSVRGMFPEGDPLYENAGFLEKNHIQICVRNPNCIKGYFLPRALNNDYKIV